MLNIFRDSIHWMHHRWLGSNGSLLDGWTACGPQHQLTVHLETRPT